LRWGRQAGLRVGADRMKREFKNIFQSHFKSGSPLLAAHTFFNCQKSTVFRRQIARIFGRCSRLDRCAACRLPPAVCAASRAARAAPPRSPFCSSFSLSHHVWKGRQGRQAEARAAVHLPRQGHLEDRTLGGLPQASAQGTVCRVDCHPLRACASRLYCLRPCRRASLGGMWLCIRMQTADLHSRRVCFCFFTALVRASV
jgi:hypothetical protein